VINTKEPDKILPYIKHAGTIFMGKYSPVSLGDYLAGPNHVLPTGGNAKFSSPLSAESFFKKSNLISYTLPALKKDAKYIKVLAENEKLDAHWAAVKIRTEK
jgi:histidinol dehydrogenase